MNTITTGNALTRPTSGDTQVAAPLSIAAPGALYAVGSSGRGTKNPESELLAPFGRETALRGRRLTRDEQRVNP